MLDQAVTGQLEPYLSLICGRRANVVDRVHGIYGGIHINPSDFEPVFRVTLHTLPSPLLSYVTSFIYPYIVSKIYCLKRDIRWCEYEIFGSIKKASHHFYPGEVLFPNSFGMRALPISQYLKSFQSTYMSLYIPGFYWDNIAIRIKLRCCRKYWYYSGVICSEVSPFL